MFIKKNGFICVLFSILFSAYILLSVSCTEEKSVPIEQKAIVQVTPESPTSPAKKETKYVEISAEETPIFIKPAIDSEMINKAKKGDIFEFVGEQAEWYEINMFSGEYRYILKTNAIETKFASILPEDKIQVKIFEELDKIEDRTMLEADKKYSPEEFYKSIDYERVLLDRYKLDLFHRYKISPILNNALVVSSVSKRLGK